MLNLSWMGRLAELCLRTPIWIGLLVFVFPSSGMAELPVKRVGVVMDGEDALYRELADQFRIEVKELVAEEFQVELAEGSPLVCDFSQKCVEEKLQQLLQDKSVDVVVGHGFLASAAIMEQKTLSKPALAPFVIDPAAQSGELPGAKKNLGYLLWSSDFGPDLRVLDQLSPYTHVAVFIGPMGISQLPTEVQEGLKKAAAGLGKKVTFIPVQDADQAILHLTEDIDAAYVGPLVGVSRAEQQKLAKSLLKRHIASVSWLGETGVEMGFLLGTRPASSQKNMARRFALAMQSLLLGETSDPVGVQVDKDKLYVNGPVAQSLGLSFEIPALLNAKIIGATQMKQSATASLSLRQAVEAALHNNLDLAVAEYGVRVVEQEAKQARSPLLPQLGARVDARLIDPDRALPMNRQRQASWGATARQVIYDERSWGNYSSAKHETQAEEKNRERIKLNVIYQVASAYIQLLQAETLLKIRNEDLELSRENLDMARVRQRVGQAGMEEVYRWEARIAQSRRELLLASANTANARVSLNTLLNRPATTPLKLEELDLDTSSLLSADERFRKALSSPSELRRLMELMVEEGIRRAPELSQIDAQLLAVKRQVTAEKRSYFLPTFGVEGNFAHRFAQGGDGQIPANVQVGGLIADQYDWQLGAYAELPLFEGALKSSRIGKGNAREGQLSVQKENTALLIEQDVRQSLYVASASYATIAISVDAAKATEGNLRIVKDKYQRGRATILDLLDAQNQAIVAQADAANSVFSFLGDLMAMERATGRFDFLVSSDEQRAFLNSLMGQVPSAASQAPSAGSRTVN